MVAEMQRAVYLENIYFICTEKNYLYLIDNDMPSHQNAILTTFNLPPVF